MGIGNQTSAALLQLGSKVRPIETCQPKSVSSHLRIGTTKHFKIQISNCLFNCNGRMCRKVLSAKTPSLFAAKANKINRTFQSLAQRKRARQFQDADTAGGVIVSAIEDLVGSVSIVTDTQMVEMRAEKNRFACKLWI